MPNVRPLNRRYGISKHAFLTAYSYCHQYREWHKALTSGAREDDHGSSVAEIEEKIRKIENTVAEAVQDYPALYPFMLEYVTEEGTTFQQMQQKGIPWRQHAVLYAAPPLLLPDDQGEYKCVTYRTRKTVR